MIEFIFKQKSDAIKLQEYLNKEFIQSWFHETLFQHKRHYNLTIEVSPFFKEREKLFNGVTRFVLNDKCMDWSESVLRENYFYEDSDEINQILEIVSEMRMGERPELIELIGEWDEGGYVRDSLEHLLEGKAPISFDSFSKFRLKKLEERLLLMVDLAIDEYKMEQEYQMFVHMLREYLASREQKVLTIHLYSTGYGFRFFDEDMKELTRQDLTKAIDKRLLTNHPLYVDSYTIAPLLSLAPRKIHVYGNGDHQLVRTLQNIFEERIELLPLNYFPDTLLYPSWDIASE
ncbi:putative sporulation protein YtxC [Bacillus sp. AFS015802]|uniref:putative sporulation protein YtxC n=1 Tax=Bacillus sp. AFS015802 TaxID=2033486 RepID=UPI000BF9AE86|nr:putative sporulation protein YtxC [Bacillus sp. AFS015802]PFA61830.1 putative sporulation protein YtxC [Bacillus sp. AFS015802]